MEFALYKSVYVCMYVCMTGSDWPNAHPLLGRSLPLGRPFQLHKSYVLRCLKELRTRGKSNVEGTLEITSICTLVFLKLLLTCLRKRF